MQVAQNFTVQHRFQKSGELSDEESFIHGLCFKDETVFVTFAELKRKSPRGT